MGRWQPASWTSTFRRALLTVAVLCAAPGAVWAEEVVSIPSETFGDCSRAIDDATRGGIAKTYACRRAGECIDAQVGQAFWLDDAGLKALPVRWVLFASDTGSANQRKIFRATTVRGSQVTWNSTQDGDRQRTGLQYTGGPQTRSPTVVGAGRRQECRDQGGSTAVTETQQTIDPEKQRLNWLLKSALASSMAASDPKTLCAPGKTDCQSTASEIKRKASYGLGNVESVQALDSLQDVHSLLSDRNLVPKPTKSAEDAAVAITRAKEQARFC